MSRTKTGVAARTSLGIAVLSLTLSCMSLAVDDDRASSCGDGRSCEAAPALAQAAPECTIDDDCEEGESCLQGECRPCEPSAEVCNGVDDDCDRAVDEDWQIGFTCLAQGQCGFGTYECVPDSDDAICSTGPGGSKDASQPEVCDGLDNNCDGQVDEAFGIRLCCTTVIDVCANGVMQSCPDTESIPEVCDGVDNDCDGAVDEDPAYWVSRADGFANDECSHTSWQSMSSDLELDYAGADAYCEGLELGGFDDWSLPTSSDFLAIVDCQPGTSCTGCSAHPKCGQLFQYAASGSYWGKRASDAAALVTLDFDSGDARTIEDEQSEPIRAGALCVRHF